jgi:hypothetical protein
LLIEAVKQQQREIKQQQKTASRANRCDEESAG